MNSPTQNEEVGLPPRMVDFESLKAERTYRTGLLPGPGKRMRPTHHPGRQNDPVQIDANDHDLIPPAPVDLNQRFTGRVTTGHPSPLRQLSTTLTDWNRHDRQPSPPARLVPATGYRAR